jgi:hypothetical protein
LIKEIAGRNEELGGIRPAGSGSTTENGISMPNHYGLKNIIPRIFRKSGVMRVLRAGEHRLQELSQALKRINVETEEEFLTTGKYLQDFSSRAKEISEASAATAGIIGGPELNNAIAELDHIFQQTKLLEGECEKGTNVLSDIIKILDLIQSSIVGYVKIVKTLKVLGTFVRVESARLGSRGTEFATLAQEINQLGKDIEEKYTIILIKSQVISSSIKKSLANVLNIKSNQKDQLKVVINKIMVILDSLKKKYNFSLATTTTLSENYYNVSRKISDIVMSLQFHDITRQQIEHVEEALHNVLSLFQEKSHQDGHRLQVIILAAHICKIQEAQLTSARNKLTEAVSCIIGNLESIARDILAISQQVQELVGDASRDGNSFLVEMEKYVDAVGAGLNLFGAAQRDLSELMQAMAAAIVDMGKFLLDIERIEIAIERLALNACIKAAHLGENGNALAVLAETTQILVGETRQQTLAVSANLSAINAAAQQLTAGQGGGEAAAEVDVASLIADLGSVLKTLGSLNENAISGLTQVDHQGTKLSADLTKAGEELTVHEYAGAMLDRVISGIRELEKQLQAAISKENGSTELDDEELARLKAQYTMADEREVHDHILITASTPISEETVARDQNEGKTTADNEPDNPINFGDNVELF